MDKTHYLIDDAFDFTCYTLKILSNEKYFCKSKRWIITQKMADCINDFYTYLSIANNMFAKTDIEKKTRLNYFKVSRAHLKAFVEKLPMANGLGCLNAERFEKWSNTCNELLVRLNGQITKEENSLG